MVKFDLLFDLLGSHSPMRGMDLQYRSKKYPAIDGIVIHPIAPPIANREANFPEIVTNFWAKENAVGYVELRPAANKPTENHVR